MGTWEKEVSNDTKEMINRIIKMNDNLHELKKKYTKYSIVFWLLVLCFSLYIFVYMTKIAADNEFLHSLSLFVTSKIHITIIIISGALFLKLKNISTKEIGIKKKVETLRFELIDHLKNTWYKSEHTHIRDQISLDLEEKGIDVRFKG